MICLPIFWLKMIGKLFYCFGKEEIKGKEKRKAEHREEERLEKKSNQKLQSHQRMESILIFRNNQIKGREQLVLIFFPSLSHFTFFSLSLSFLFLLTEKVRRKKKEKEWEWDEQKRKRKRKRESLPPVIVTLNAMWTTAGCIWGKVTTTVVTTGVQMLGKKRDR